MDHRRSEVRSFREIDWEQDENTNPGVNPKASPRAIPTHVVVLVHHWMRQLRFHHHSPCSLSAEEDPLGVPLPTTTARTVHQPPITTIAMFAGYGTHPLCEEWTGDFSAGRLAGSNKPSYVVSASPTRTHFQLFPPPLLSIRGPTAPRNIGDNIMAPFFD